MLDIRFILMGLVAAFGMYFVLTGSSDESGSAVARGPLGSDFDALIDQACAQQPAHCECVAPAMRRIGQDEEVLSVFLEMMQRAVQGPGVVEWMAERFRDMPRRLRSRVFAVIQDIDLQGMNTCLARIDPIYNRLTGDDVNAEALEAFLEAMQRR